MEVIIRWGLGVVSPTFYYIRQEGWDYKLDGGPVIYDRVGGYKWMDLKAKSGITCLSDYKLS